MPAEDRAPGGGPAGTSTLGRIPFGASTPGRVPLGLGTLLVAGALIAGCGGSDESGKAPEASPPATTTESPTSEETAEQPANSGGTESPEAGSKKDGTPKNQGGSKDKQHSGSNKDGSGNQGGQGPSELDSKENDLPPEKGSPAEAFEKFCDENPKACG